MVRAVIKGLGGLEKIFKFQSDFEAVWSWVMAETGL